MVCMSHLSFFHFNIHQETKQERRSGAICFTLTHPFVVILTKTSHNIGNIHLQAHTAALS